MAWPPPGPIWLRSLHACLTHWFHAHHEAQSIDLLAWRGREATAKAANATGPKGARGPDLGRALPDQGNWMLWSSVNKPARSATRANLIDLLQCPLPLPDLVQDDPCRRVPGSDAVMTPVSYFCSRASISLQLKSRPVPLHSRSTPSFTYSAH